MPKEIIALIPARLDSSRFPRKLLAKKKGKPIIQYAWEVATNASLVTRVCIATDSDEIARVVDSFGGEVIITGTHPNGTSRIAEAANELGGDIIVNVQGDEPELDSVVIDSAINVLANSQMSTVVCPLQKDEMEDPNVVKAVVENNFAINFSRKFIDGSFRHIGLYVYKPSFLQTYIHLEPTPNEISRRLEQMRAIDHGYQIAVAEVKPQPGGIDTIEQYEDFVNRVL